MKLVVVGFGRCGCRLADEFARLDRRARRERGIGILSGALAADTDTADLHGLGTISPGYRHRLLLGNRGMGGHGVGKINEVGAAIAREGADKIVEAIMGLPRWQEADAFLLIGSSGGGTGSGSLPIITKHLKERFWDKPLWDLVVLPFDHEEAEERTVYNSATCLKSVSAVADAVFLIDNQRYIRKNLSLRGNIAQINSLIAAPFYNLLCVGEEKERKWIGAKTLDIADIVETVSGWTAVGHGKEPLAGSGFSFRRGFSNKGDQTRKGVQTMDEALSELSLRCNPASSGRALYLLSAPAGEIDMDLVKEVGDYLRSVAPMALVRSGDYPRGRDSLDITLILSELGEVEKVRGYYSRVAEFRQGAARRRAEVQDKLREMNRPAEDVPFLTDHGGHNS